MRRLAVITLTMFLAASFALVLLLRANSSPKRIAAPDPTTSSTDQGTAKSQRALRAGVSSVLSSSESSLSFNDPTEGEISGLELVEQLPVAKARHIADIAHLFPNETDPFARGKLATELGEIEDPAAARQILALLKTEQDSEVRLALLRALSLAHNRREMADEILQTLSALYNASQQEDLSGRVDILNTLGDIAAAPSVEFLRKIYLDSKADPQERLSAAENLMRLRTQDPELISLAEAQHINAQLRLEAQAADDPQVRSLAIMGLAERREENLQFLQQMLATETDENVRLLLEKLTS